MRQLLATLAAIMFLAVPARGQFEQFTDVGDGFEAPIDQAALDDAMSNARWRVGNLFVQPTLGLRNVAATTSVGFGDNAGGRPRTDLTAGLGTGLRSYYPIGARFTWTGHVLPEYTWWSKQSERSRLNGRYGMGLFGHLGGTAVELSATRKEELANFSREFEDLVSGRTDTARLAVEVPIKGVFAIYAESRIARHENLEATQAAGLPDLSALDRELLGYEAGVRLHSERGWTLGLGVGTIDIDFYTPGALDRSGTAEAIRLSWQTGERDFSIQSKLGWTTYRPDIAVGATEFNGLTGGVFLRRQLRGSIEVDAKIARSLGFSLRPGAAYTDNILAGVGVRISLGTWGTTRLLAETGTLEFPQLEATGVVRRDDLLAYGINFGFKVTNVVQFTIGVLHTEYNSNLPQFDRTLTVTHGGVRIGIRRERNEWL